MDTSPAGPDCNKALTTAGSTGQGTRLPVDCPGVKLACVSAGPFE